MSTHTAPDRIVVGGDEVVVRVSSAETGGALLAIDVRMHAGGGPPALHRHAPAEVYRVQTGELTFYDADAGGVVRRATHGPGDVVHIPAGREHTVRNESGSAATASVTFVPGGAMERFVRAAGRVPEGATMEDVVALAATHGVEITRPLPG
jgi:mannose-6-phosphate isomerase-like protein (cupin superfamily)